MTVATISKTQLPLLLLCVVVAAPGVSKFSPRRGCCGEVNQGSAGASSSGGNRSRNPR